MGTEYVLPEPKAQAYDHPRELLDELIATADAEFSRAAREAALHRENSTYARHVGNTLETLKKLRAVIGELVWD